MYAISPRWQPAIMVGSRTLLVILVTMNAVPLKSHGGFKFLKNLPLGATYAVGVLWVVES